MVRIVRRDEGKRHRRVAVAKVVVASVLALLIGVYASLFGRMLYASHIMDATNHHAAGILFENNDDKLVVVGYAVTLTSCGSEKDASLTDGGAVLKHSIHLNSVRTPSSGSRYDYRMYALVHPDAMSCAPKLQAMGYELLVRDLPVPVADIQNAKYRERVVNNGCCGASEFVKLHAYTLVQHDIVVHLDLDTLILKPLDDLFDAMLHHSPSSSSSLTTEFAVTKDIEFGTPLPANNRIDAFFTRDYNMASKRMKHVGVQGGFLVLRPSLSVYEEFRTIIHEGRYDIDKGWGGKGYGPFYGALTFQGIIPYFYDELYPNTAVELTHCVYNQMCDNPRSKPTINDVVSGSCRIGTEECEDCRSRPIEQVKTAHFTLCQKPWTCTPQKNDNLQSRLCRKLHHAWFETRADLERSWGRTIPDPHTEGTYDVEQFFGFCKRPGTYLPMEVPKTS